MIANLKYSVYFILFIFFSVILVQKMTSDNLNSGHFGYTHLINRPIGMHYTKDNKVFGFGYSF